MDYKETLAFLYEQLPMYQNQGRTAFKKDLKNTLELCKSLGNPEKKFKSIHVAGTNGKGSCSHMLASIFQEAGFSVGLYTSPHLKDFRERIKINGLEISKNKVVDFVENNKAFFHEIRPSFFEWTVALAFDYFAKKKVDLAIIETGLGGRLDSTNVLNPELSIITNIGFDHMDLLGDSLDKIATEKAGIIKANTPVVIGNPSGQLDVFASMAQQNKSKLVLAQNQSQQSYKSDLMGAYQEENKQTVIAAIGLLREMGWDVSDSAIEKGLLTVVKNTGLRGRWESIGTNPLQIADTAHNYDGLKYTITQALQLNKPRIHFVLGFVREKNLDSILDLFPKDALYYFSAANNSRSLVPESLYEAAKKKGLHGGFFATVEEALNAARQSANKDDLIYIGGSTFVVSEVI